MFDYIRGELTELTPTQAVIETAGVGFSVNISLTTYDDIQGRREAKLYMYEMIREDAFTLYGFSSKSERSVFALLLGVSGVGGNTARTILSAYSPSEFVSIIEGEQVSELKRVKGIGMKTAERIIVDLKGRIKDLSGIKPTEIQIHSDSESEAIQALCALGYTEAMARKAVTAIVKLGSASANTEDLIKQALKML